MATASASNPGPYPVTYEVDQQLGDHNRVTSLFRIILAIPHLILVGGPGVVSGGLSFGANRGSGGYGAFLSGGVLGAVGGVMAVVSWFAILFTGKMPQGLWDFIANVLRWRARSNAYMALLRDEYPPFGFEDSGYGARISFAPQPAERNRVTVAFRIILAIPHFIVLLFVGIAWAIVEFIAWLAIIFTGNFPDGLYTFSVGYLRWSMRVEAYLYLLTDEYPPFSLEPA